MHNLHITTAHCSHKSIYLQSISPNTAKNGKTCCDKPHCFFCRKKITDPTHH